MAGFLEVTKHALILGMVHGFIKKTRKTLPEDIALARRRMKEMTR